MKRFVPESIAKTLKKKGFNEACFAIYNPNGVFMWKFLCSDEDNDHTLSVKDIMEFPFEQFTEAPTYQDTLEWLRDKHKIDIVIDLSFNQHPAINNGAWLYQGYNVILWKNSDESIDLTANTFKNYNDALIYSITEALKLI